LYVKLIYIQKIFENDYLVILFNTLHHNSQANKTKTSPEYGPDI